jgi:branched-chain amino acid transport system ATP-binding protein
VEVKYHEVILVLKGVSLEIPEGGIIALLGANGAGKSTTLKAISGLLKVEVGEVTDGAIEFKGERIHRKTAMEISKMGIVQVIEGRKVFEHLTVEENLKVGAHLRKTGSVREGLEMVYHYFPRLREKRSEVAGYVSGGEQQMLTIARTLMGNVEILLLDEPTANLDPYNVSIIEEVLVQLNRDLRTTILLVTHNVFQPKRIAERTALLLEGELVEIGNTNSRYRFACGAREFVRLWTSYGPAHHCAVGVGHISDKIEKLGALLGLDTARVC